MPQFEDLESILPRLRRFARASTADKEIADKCVERALEQIESEAEQSEEELGLSAQVRFYRAVEQELENQAGGSFQKQAWRALILVFVEGFSETEAARILGVDAARVVSMAASAEKQVRVALSENAR